MFANLTDPSILPHNEEILLFPPFLPLVFFIEINTEHLINSVSQSLRQGQTGYVLTVTHDHTRLLIVSLFCLSLSPDHVTSPPPSHPSPPFTASVTSHLVFDWRSSVR